MRTVTFIFALSFLTTLGWRVHSTLLDWTTPVRIDLSSISKVITIVESQSIKQKEYDGRISAENFFAKVEQKIDQQIKNERIANRKLVKSIARRVVANKTIKARSEKIEFLKSEKIKFGLTENKFENIKYSINYQNLEHHYVAFEFKSESSKELIANKSEVVEQEVKTVAAKSTAINDLVKNEQKDEQEEDIKIFEYSNDEAVTGSIEPKDSKASEQNPLVTTQKTDVSANVNRAIEREMGHSPQNQVVAAQSSPIKPKIKIDLNQDAGSMGPLALNTQTQVSDALKDSGKKTENNFLSTQDEIALRAGGVDFTGREMSIQNYEIIPFDDDNEIISSDSEGLLKLKMPAGKSRLISVRSEGYLATNLKINSESTDTVIPMIAKDEFEKLLNKFRLHGEGAFLVVQLDDEIKNIELDKPSEAKVFLDKDFKIVEKDKSPTFMLFIGVAPGNTMIGYDFSKNKQVNKIVYLGEGELYFENEEFDRKSNLAFSLTTKELMGQGKTALNVNSEVVASFNDNQESKKITLNTYGFKDIVSVKNDSNYFELRLGDHNLFFTAKDGDEVELPSKTYLNEILAQFNLNSLKESCVVQINIDEHKKLEQLKFNGRSYQGFENIELLALDNDGSLGSEVTDTTKKIFLSGNAQGVMNLKFKYTDDSFDYHQTYCSPGIYLVEHL